MTKTRDLSDFLIEGGADLPLGVPHIIPGVLYPAISGKLLDGTTSHSGNYGTAQSDGRKYYYTDIKGSKPIKDPRIGAHFGSQRHKLKSIQLLEQETTTEGFDVYSVDGREWMRAVSKNTGWSIEYGSGGNYLNAPSDNTGSFIEITGYFNDINFSLATHPNRGDDIDITVNGTLSVDGSSTLGGKASGATPLGSRYVDYGSFINGGSTLSTSLGTTPRINTLKYELKTASSEYVELFAIELIAQDTTSTANRSKIQIPSQNVVSFGKKFTVSGTPHYDPFTTMSYGGSGTTLSALQSLIDTDTSLGMDAWKAGTSNYHRPWNGGRVVKWVDSSGTIKTSVNMMPPNAQNITTTASNAVSDAHVIAGTNDDTINFNTSAINNEQSELAKSFYNREFGNGSANGGTGSASYPDVSMLSAADDVAYVMDDGLTSISAKDVRYNSYDETLHRNGTSTVFYLTFIGTGIARHASRSSGVRNNFAQNLPYGTHILSMIMYSNADLCRWYLDGVEILDNADSPYSSNQSHYHNIGELFHIHQPKRPPIPEDACVITDYMLMADFVAIANDGPQYISKGVRLSPTNRDAFFDTGGGSTWNATTVDVVSGLGGMYQSNSGTDNDQNFFISEFFGSDAVFRMYDTPNRVGTTQVRTGSGSFTSVTPTKTGSGHGAFAKGLTPTSLGSNATKIFGASSQYFTPVAMEFATPIHTSSHYQTFETPFLHELVGGDRNMEQTNLVVSPDGKTWDQVTRDVSYIGNIRCTIGINTTNQGNSNPIIWDVYRGGKTSVQFEDFMTKDFAIAYDRIICLVDGQYEIHYWTYVNSNTTEGDHRIKLNGQFINQNYTVSMNTNSIDCLTRYHLKRGDYLQIQGSITSTMGGFQITKV